MPPCHLQNGVAAQPPGHSALPHLASAYFQGLMAHVRSSCMLSAWGPPVPRCGFMSHSVLGLFPPFVITFFLLGPPDLLSFVFYQHSAKTLPPKSQVSLVFSGLSYISFNSYKISLNCSYYMSVSPWDHKLFRGRGCLIHFWHL